MIIDKLENLKKYIPLYPSISNLIEFLEMEELSSLTEKVIFKEISMLPLTNKKNIDFSPEILEAHRKMMDIHITLEGIDYMAFKFLNERTKVFKEYDEQNDYLLLISNERNILPIEAGFFCIVPNEFAHMAFYEADEGVKKVVVKLPS